MKNSSYFNITIMKTVNDLIIELQNLRNNLRDKPVVVICPNGLESEAKVKIGLEKPYEFDKVKNITITYE